MSVRDTEGFPCNITNNWRCLREKSAKGSCGACGDGSDPLRECVAVLAGTPFGDTRRCTAGEVRAARGRVISARGWSARVLVAQVSVPAFTGDAEIVGRLGVHPVHSQAPLEAGTRVDGVRYRPEHLGLDKPSPQHVDQGQGQSLRAQHRVQATRLQQVLALVPDVILQTTIQSG
jgi:hypothetical protein